MALYVGSNTIITSSAAFGPAFVTPVTTFNTFKANWKYSGTISPLSSAPTSVGSDPVFSNYNYNDSSWSSVDVSTDYVSDVSSQYWYVRKLFWINAGTFTYSGTVDDDEAWYLVPPSGAPIYAGGNVADIDGGGSAAWSARSVTVATSGLYYFTGRGGEGGGADYLYISSVDSGLNLFYTVLN